MNKYLTNEEYFNHSYNKTIENARAVEVPLAKRWMNGKGSLIEVGAVMPYYINCTHSIIDPFDPRGTIVDYVENQDLTGYDVLSISTVEHIGEGGNESKAIYALSKMMDEANSFFITFPAGHNKTLTNWVENNLSKLNCFGYKKLTHNPPVWEYYESPETVDYPFGSLYPGANFIIFLIG